MSDLSPTEEAELERLLAAERSYEERPGDDVRSRVRSAVVARVGLLGGGGGGGGGKGGATTASKGPSTMTVSRAVTGMVGTFLVGGVVGAVVMQATIPHGPSSLASTPPPIVVSTAPVTSSASPRAEPPILELPSTPAATARPATSASADGQAIAAERALLDAARISLANGEPAQALALVERHETEFPRGRLIEEREALAIRALVKLGRGDEARTRGERFRKTWPRSLALPAVSAALGSLE